MKGYRKILVNNYIMFVLPDQKSEVLNVMRVLYYARDYFKELCWMGQLLKRVRVKLRVKDWKAGNG